MTTFTTAKAQAELLELSELWNLKIQWREGEAALADVENRILRLPRPRTPGDYAVGLRALAEAIFTPDAKTHGWSDWRLGVRASSWAQGMAESVFPGCASQTAYAIGVALTSDLRAAERRGHHLGEMHRRVGKDRAMFGLRQPLILFPERYGLSDNGHSRPIDEDAVRAALAGPPV